jgi:hypothetical protein
LRKYTDAIQRNSTDEIERTTAEVNGIADESNAAVNAMNDMLSRGVPQVSDDELEAYMADLSSHQSSPRTPPPPAIFPAGFVRRHSRSGSNKKK